MNRSTIRETENFHILLWLVKDSCWVMDLKIAGMLMIIPTVFVAVWLTWRSLHDRADFFHNLAVCCWILANSIWMTGEFFFKDTFRPFAIVFFALGLLCVAYYYLFLRPKTRRTPKA